MEIASFHLIGLIAQEGHDGVAGPTEVISFDEADIQGTFHVPGHPGVIGLWLAASTVAGTLAAPVKTSLDASLYEVPDLRPADNGYMFVRGFVWSAPAGKRAYP